jgi:cation-transporting ATPase 13A3/4/5
MMQSWLFMDGVWMMTMAFTLPLAKAHNKLSPKLPVGDLLGIHTMSSVLGVLSINIIFTFIALVTLWNSSFFQCRRWSSKNVSNVTTIGDNYEASVLFLVTGYQYISTAMAFNYGYCFRAGFLKNRVFVLLAVGFTVIHFIITVYPGDLSCLWRVNCTNDHVQRGITTGFQPLPINNPFNTTVMPVSFRWTLIVIIISNTIAVQCWEVFFINGVGLKWEESYQQSNITPISDLVNPVKTDDEVDDLELAHVPVQSAVKA